MTSSPRSRWAARLFGTLRVGALLAVLSGTAALFALRSAEAHLGEVLESLGARIMLSAPGARYGSAPRRLVVNGVTFHLVTASVEREMPEVLDHFAALCKQRGGVIDAERALAALQAGGPLPASGASLFDGVHRTESETEGVVACLDSGGPIGPQELVHLGTRLLETGDLSAIGELRYALARASEGGTSLLLLWTEGETRLLDMFPARGDSPGADPRDLPRPRGGRRLLSATEAGAPYAVTLYTTAEPVAEVAGDYRRQLEQRGWHTHALAPGAPTETLSAEKGGRWALIRITTGADGQTVVSIEELA